MVGPGHLVLEPVLLLLEGDLALLLLVDQLVALDAQQVQLLDLVLQHELQLLDVRLVQLVPLQPLLLLQLEVQRQSVVRLRKRTQLNRVSLLDLHRGRLYALHLVPSLRQLARQLVVLLGEDAVLLEQGLDLDLEILRFAQFDLEKGDLIEQPACLSLRAQSVLEAEFLLEQFPLDPGRGAARIGRRFSVVGHGS